MDELSIAISLQNAFIPFFFAALHKGKSPASYRTNPSNVLLKNELFLRKHDCKTLSAHRSTYFF